MERKINPKRVIQIDYDSRYQEMLWEMIKDELEDILNREPYRMEDHGVGAYEYWGFTGCDTKMVPVIELNQDIIELWVPKNVVDELGGEDEVSDMFTDGTDEMTAMTDIENYEITVVAKFNEARWENHSPSGSRSKYYVGNYSLRQE
tara:strand:+ start:2254 stop:2694 length:441 start_codon:yes stop_codon:yes gene_type:complete